MLIGEERFHFRGFAVMLLLFVSATALLVGLAELLRGVASTIPAVLYGGSFLATLYIILTYIMANDRKIVRFMATGGSEIIAAMLVTATLAATVLFGLVCRELAMGLGAGFAGGDTAGALTWVGFGFDNLLEAMLLDAPNIYGLHFTDITPTLFWSQTLVLVFRTLANLLMLRALLRSWGFLRRFLFAERLAAGGR